MKEILFRGKRIDNGEWLTSKSIDQWNDGRVFLFNEDEGNCIEVIPETVGQYTGLKDKNGTKIFEGDIVNIKHQHEIVTGKIEYIDDRFIVAVKMWAGDLRHYAKTRNLFCEVVGNIYDTPNLMEDKE